jgi:hypothetical protein
VVGEPITVSASKHCFESASSADFAIERCPACQGTSCCPTFPRVACSDGTCRSSFSTTTPGYYDISAVGADEVLSIKVKSEDAPPKRKVCSGELDEGETGFLCGSGNQPPSCHISVPNLRFDYCNNAHNNQFGITCNGNDPDDATLTYSWPSGPGSCVGNTCAWTATEGNALSTQSWTCEVQDPNGLTSRCSAKARVRSGDDFIDQLAVARATTDPHPTPLKNTDDPITVDAGETVYLVGDEQNSNCSSYQWSWVRCPTAVTGTASSSPPCPTIAGANSKYASFIPPFGDADSDEFSDAEGQHDYILELEVTQNGVTETAKLGVNVIDNPPTAVLNADNDTGFSEGGGFGMRKVVSDCAANITSSTQEYKDVCPDNQASPDLGSDQTVKTREKIFFSVAGSSDDVTPLSELKFYFVWDDPTDGTRSPMAGWDNWPRVNDQTHPESPGAVGDTEFWIEPLVEGLYADKSSVPAGVNAKAPYYQVKVVAVDQAGHGMPPVGGTPPSCSYDSPPFCDPHKLTPKRYNWPKTTPLGDGSGNIPDWTPSGPGPAGDSNVDSVILRVDDTALFNTLYGARSW